MPGACARCRTGVAATSTSSATMRTEEAYSPASRAEAVVTEMPCWGATDSALAAGEGPEAPVGQAAVEHRREQRRRVGIRQAAGQLHLQVSAYARGSGWPSIPSSCRRARRDRWHRRPPGARATGYRRGHHAALRPASTYSAIWVEARRWASWVIGDRWGVRMAFSNSCKGESVQGSASKESTATAAILPAATKSGQGVHVEDAAAGSVHEHDTVLHGSELVGAEHAQGTHRAGQVHRDEVGLGESPAPCRRERVTPRCRGALRRCGRSCPMRFMPKAAPLRHKTPTRPRPKMASVLPNSSLPMKSGTALHCPACMEALASGMWRAAATGTP